MSSSIGKIFKLTTFGESHGVAIGGILEGCPAGLQIDFYAIQKNLNRRRPGSESIFSSRNEHDKVEFLSGILDGITLGTPIGFLINNQDQKPGDYNTFKDVFRPSHADYTYQEKYGLRDHRGGGRSSARETANWVVAGSIASQVLSLKGISIYSYVQSIGSVFLKSSVDELDLNLIYENEVRCPCQKMAKKMKDIINTCKDNGDTVGGEIFTIIKGLPPGLGAPVFNKLNASLAMAIMSVNACKGVAFGSGFLGARNKGSEENDVFVKDENGVRTLSNNSGGIQGGISNGEDICFQSAFKPVSTISKEQQSINSDFQKIHMKFTGRHDPCIVPRAVPVVSSLAAIVVLDHFLLNKTIKLTDL